MENRTLKKKCPIYRSFLKGQRVTMKEEVLWKNNGVALPCLYSSVPIIKNRTIQGSVISVVDISEQKRTQTSLDELSKRLELAQEAGEIGVFEWDLETDTIWWSKEQEKLYGLPEKSFQGTLNEFRQLVHPDDFKRLKQEAQICKRNHTDQESEFRVFFPDSTIHWLKVKARFYYNARGKATKLVGINYDITKRKALEETLQFKAESSRILNSSLEYEQTLSQVAKLAIRYIADWCSVTLVENGQLNLVAITHSDPDKVVWAKHLQQQNPPKLSDPTGVAKVIRTGKTEFYPLISEDIIRKTISDKKTLKILKKLQLTSIIIAPIKTKDKTIGAISFVSAESKRIYTQRDVEMAEQLASRASLAIENASLYKQVWQEQERLHNVVSNVPGVVWEAWGKPDDKHQRINYVSAYVETMLGYTVQDWLSSPNFWLKIVHPQDQTRAAQESANFFNSGTGGRSRFRWIKKDGSSIWVESQSQVIKDSSGKSVGLRGVTMDITSTMEVEQRKDEFISIASHELKTPITSIRVFTQILLAACEEKGTAKEKTYLLRMRSQIDKLTQLVSDLLDISKIEVGKLELRKETFQLGLLVTEVVENMQATTDSHKLVVKGSSIKKIHGDRDRIGQVLINFLSNAIKYSPNGKPIIISTHENKQTITVAVKDKGIGIKSKHLEHIFERFYRVFDATEKTFPGLGIGLFICKEIIQRHNGSIHVESKLHKGSTFSFTLPFD